MATCASCNGWGVIQTIMETAPSSSLARLQARKLLNLSLREGKQTYMRLAEHVCVPCGGFGTRASNDAISQFTRREG